MHNFHGDNLAERLSLHGVTTKVSQALSDNRDYVLYLLPKAMNALYHHALAHPSLTHILTNEAQKDALIALQIEHWGIMLKGEFAEDYIASVKRIGELHHRVGLEPRWYIGGYNFLLRSLISLMTIENLGDDLVATRDALVVTPILQALTSAVMFDMDCVIDAFMSFREMYLD